VDVESLVAPLSTVCSATRTSATTSPAPADNAAPVKNRTTNENTIARRRTVT
jgi:hypothetical protein